MNRALATIVAVVVVPYLALMAAAWFWQRRMIYLPFGDVPPASVVGLPQAEEVTLRTEDGLALQGWFVPARLPDLGVTAILFNGNGGNRAYRAPLAAALATRGIATLMFDYRGYARNPGKPSEAGLAIDARAALDYVRTRPGADRMRITYLGDSLGCAVAIRLATEQPPRALILRSPFTSLADVARHHYPFLPVRWLLRETYPSADLISRVRAPVLVISGDRDSIIPVAQSKRLYAAAREPKSLVIIENADHNDYAMLAGEQIVEAMVAFVARQ